MIFLAITGGICLFSIRAFLVLIRKSGAKPAKVVPVREQEFKSLFGIKGVRRDFVDTEGGILAFFRIMPMSIAGSTAQCSIICEHNSTKSLGVAVPLTIG